MKYYCKRRKKWISYYGDTYRDGRQIIIRLNQKLNRRRRDAWETLLQEWCHAMEWKGSYWETHPENVEGERDHTPAFWAQYGEIYEWFFHQNAGWELGLVR